MATNTPYICARCLRAGPRLRKSIPSVPSSANLQTRGNRAYHLQRSTPPTLLSRSMIAVKSLSTRQQTRLITAHTLTKLPTPEHATLPGSSSFDPPQATTTTTTTSSSQSSPKTKTLINPRHDPDTGTENAIQISARAAKRLEHIMQREANPNLHLRVTVESGGCHGFQYLMSLEDVSKVDEAEDTAFVSVGNGSLPAGTEDGEGWRAQAAGRATVVMDESSLELLKGSTVDYTMELIGSQFKIADNPGASSSCGCGTSFDVKI